MLPSAHINRVGVRVVSFRSSIAHPAYTPVYAGSLAVAAQDSGPSGSLVLSLLHAGLARRTNIAISLIDL
jgi:hypothetical protein